MSKKIAIGGDHAGYYHKEKMVKFLESKGYEVKDFGPFSADSADYPDFVHPVCDSIESGNHDFGVLICGSGQGVTITANKHQNIRAALCWDTDLAEVTRQHNNSNVICLAARWTAYELAESIVETFLNSEFEGGRHQRRVDKISC
ncbi:MAG: ribose 5-phosphate isomerase B [Flammeovirgaceae bacterium]|nr:ribose 5-phosphate isomerase B [Flammeovirgaceae bacterium]MBE60777.1 ribose 5-phosphate isomerase B [Flammeovirgaceae bacterium]HCX25040.1 ribose 5-phosphate isomerase B [Cytophagales bacterium]|tara:strand:- start:237 stop:671 length:435 start_codon:yes stop_codon:yes gene_type:complete